MWLSSVTLVWLCSNFEVQDSKFFIDGKALDSEFSYRLQSEV